MRVQGFKKTIREATAEVKGAEWGDKKAANVICIVHVSLTTTQ